MPVSADGGMPVGEPTIRDVARRAGVSVATVSRVLNGANVVAEATRERVLQAIAELGFNPNAVARSLIKRQSRIVGVVVPDIANPFFAEVARGMGDAAARLGYLVTLANSDLKGEKEIEYVRLFRSQRVDGLIYTSGTLTPGLRAALCALGRPVALAATWDPEGAWPAVLVDSYAGARLAMDHLLDLGHRRVAVICGPQEDPVSGVPRWEGYRDAARARGLELAPPYVVFGDYRWESGYRAMQQLLALPDPPTAVAAASDLMALGAVCAALDQGLAVPGDLSVVGFDNIALSGAVRPALTTVAQPMYDIGYRAMERLARAIAGEAVEPGVEWIPPRLVVRASTAPPPER